MSALREALTAAGLPVDPTRMSDHLTHDWNVPAGHKRCPKCIRIKPYRDFYIRRNGSPSSYCRPCHRANVSADYYARKEAA